MTSRTSAAWPLLSRRDFLRDGIGAVAAPAIARCDALRRLCTSGERLTARPGVPTLTPEPGLSRLGLGSSRDGNLYVPAGYSPDRPAPLYVGLHGAGSSGDGWRTAPDMAEARGMVFLAPDSRGRTWDLVLGGFGPDVEFLDQALRHTFERCAIDRSRIALGGWSDGATYALSLGVCNGDLFTHLMAYAPGFYSPGRQTRRRPRIFITHGTQDEVLPVENTRLNVVPTLRSEGYDVSYREHDGTHRTPEAMVEQSLQWFLPRR